MDALSAAASSEKLFLFQEDLEATKLELRLLQQRLAGLEALQQRLGSLDALEARLAGFDALEARLRRLEAQAVAPAPAPKELERPAETEPERQLSLNVLLADAEVSGYDLQNKPWDAAIFVGTGALGTLGSCLVMLVLALTLFGRFFFLSIILYSDGFLAARHMSREVLEEWRVNYGHTFETEKGGHSLVSRVCRGDDGGLNTANAQREVVAKAVGYLEGWAGLPQGPLLCTFCLLLWTLTNIRHVGEIGALVTSLLLLGNERTSVVRKAEGVVSLASISARRCGVMLCLLAVRLALTMTLLVMGGLWLARTGGVDDLLVNAVALTFVLDLDELLFALAPDSARRLVARCRPLPQGRPWHWHGLGVRPVMYFLACLVIMVSLGVTKIAETQAHAELMNATVCGGEQDFVIYFEPSSSRVVKHLTNPWHPAESGKFDLKETLVHRSIWRPSYRELWRAGANGSMEEARRRASISVTDLAAERPCVDEDGLIKAYSYIFGTLTEGRVFGSLQNNGSSLFETCGNFGGVPESRNPDLDHACFQPSMDLLRYACPVTCLCANPMIGFNRRGCPSPCHSTPHYRRVLTQYDCLDFGPTAFPEYWSSLRKFVRERYGDDFASCQDVTEDYCVRPSLAVKPSFRMICPVRCGCKGGAVECPTDCYDKDYVSPEV